MNKYTLPVSKTYDEMLANAVWRPLLSSTNFRNSWQIIDYGKILFETAFIFKGDTYYTLDEISTLFKNTENFCKEMTNFIIINTIQGKITLLHNAYYNNMIATLLEYTIEPTLESRFDDIIIYLRNNHEINERYNLIED